MAQNKNQSFGPVALTATLTTNVLAPAAAGAGAVGYTATATYLLLRHIRISNKSASAVSFSLWRGATGANAAGTEVVGTGMIIQPNQAYDWYGTMRLEGTSGFLVGGASAAGALTLDADGEVGLV